MWISSFNKLIDEETQTLSLKDCSVVIDGANFFHNIYKNTKIPFIFGCECDKYAEHLKKLLTMFKQANVKCYIVFKGGDTDSEKKMKKFQHLVFNIDANTEFIPPLLLRDTTLQVIEEMGIDYTFCVTEAKDDCVALAQKLECPIISFDTEYCFRNAPYIPWRNGEIKQFDEETKSIQCSQYKIQDFLKKNKLTEEKTAIFVALTDITVFPAEYFDTLFNDWRVFHRKEVYKLQNLISWLGKHSEEEARAEISKILKNDEDRRKFEFCYNNILTNMYNEEPGHATDYLLNSNIPIVRQDPEWFEKGVICKHVPPVYINLYKSKIIQGCWVILDEHSQDSLLISTDIIKYAYNLLTNYKGDTITVYQDADKYIEMQTYDPNVCRPVYDCKESVFENGWGQVKQLKLFEHFLTENCINTDVLAKLQPDCVVLFTALVYFARKKQHEGEDVTREVYAVILSYVLLSLVYNTETCSKDWKDHLKIKRVAAKYFQYDKEEAKRIFDGKTSENLVELQFCIQHMNYLNTLCGSPYEQTQYRKTYNGTLIYNMLCELRMRDVDDFVNELFQTAPVVLGVLNSLIEMYHELLTSE